MEWTDSRVDPVRSTEMKGEQGEGGLYQRFARIASAAPEHAAVFQKGSASTYQSLRTSADQFCDHLLAAGVEPHDGVAVILGNLLNFIVAAFGIWKRGAILVPLNPQLHEAEIAKYIVGTPVRGLVTSVRNRGMAEGVKSRCDQVRHLWLSRADADWIYEGSGPGSFPMADSSEVGVAPDWPAITQYSTGSTGYPKRVTRTHEQLLGESGAVSRVLRVTRDDRVLGVAPFFHSHGLMNSAVLALLSGGTLYPVESFFARDVARLLDDERITVLPGVPFMFQLLADLRERFHFFHLRCAISAGAPLPEETERAFKDVYGVGIRQLYGSTETGVICIEPDHGCSPDSRSVGTPIPGVSVRVLEESGWNQVPTGQEGRIQILSPFAASSYEGMVGSSESTFEGGSFFPGDLGRITSAGEVLLCGRHRGFINVSGNKVDPSEVELILLELPHVSEAVVFGVPDGAAGERVKAVLVTTGGVTQAEIRAHCMGRMAEFKHPKIIEFRRELPKSPLGKVLRKYLMDEAVGGLAREQLDVQIATSLISQRGVSGAESLEFAALPPFLRVLLVTDGTVTRSLEAYFCEPIDVDVLSHHESRSDRSYPDIDIIPGVPILRRCVTLRGKITRSVYAFAESIVVLGSISDEMRHKLIEERKGIGELLSAHKLETFRELLRIRRAHADDWALHLAIAKDASVVVRNYKIFQGGRAAIAIEEVFPEIRFQPDRTPSHASGVAE